MKALLTKYFEFSASHAAEGKIYGHNYRLGVTVDPVELKGENELIARIRRNLIQKLESRDLGMDVDFLKGRPIQDSSLLEIFWGILEKAAAPLKLHSISLERDRNTHVVLSAEKI